MVKNKIILISGSLGLIGFEASKLFLKKGFLVIGVDNNLRGKLLEIKTNYHRKLEYLKKNYRNQYIHKNIDIRNEKDVGSILKKNREQIHLVIHTAAQTSHDWSAKNPYVDFSINVLGTLNLLEILHKHSPKATFVFTSTNKVYGDLVNQFNYQEFHSRFDLKQKDRFFNGIPEDLSIDQSKHSLFGVSKASADLLVQEYGRYFGMKTGIFRLGVVAGESQNGAFEQGFLSYMIDSFVNNRKFKILGYKGKQVRDIIHAKDVAQAFYLYYKNSRKGEVFNLGGGRENSASILELIEKVEIITGKKPKLLYISQPRLGDHKWWISDNSKFKKMYPNWEIKHNINEIISGMYKNKI